jgi:hypothetical protein
MTTTATRSPAPPRAPGTRRRSRPLLIGAFCVVLGAVVGWLVLTRVAGGVPVVATVRAVPFGTTIAAADLREVTLPAGSTLRAVGWDQRQTVIGLLTTTDLVADQLLSPEAVGVARGPRAGTAVLGMPVGPGRLPAAGLTARDEVLVLRPDAPDVPVRATVLGVGDPDAAGRRTVDLLVPESAIGAVAAAASDERTLLVLVAGR